MRFKKSHTKAEVQLHLFVASTLDGVSGQFHTPAALTPFKHLVSSILRAALTPFKHRI